MLCIAAGSASTEEAAWTLRGGDLVVVDESAMANTSDLADIYSYCDQAGAKLLYDQDWIVHREFLSSPPVPARPRPRPER